MRWIRPQKLPLIVAWLVIVGVLLILVILVLPAGIFGFLNRGSDE